MVQILLWLVHHSNKSFIVVQEDSVSCSLSAIKPAVELGKLYPFLGFSTPRRYSTHAKVTPRRLFQLMLL